MLTKAQLMADFDRASTDRRLTRDLVERHLAQSAVEPSLLLGEYLCLVSGGSTGRRGGERRLLRLFRGRVCR